MLFNVQRWSLHDGPGIRTTLFFKGCPLRCRWCSNPESWAFDSQLLFFRQRCSGCGACVEACPQGANQIVEGRAVLDRSRCTGCGQCVAACSSTAREVVGLDLPVADILRLLRRDAVFYRSSGGGVTFSGGEPFAQPGLLGQITEGCAVAGIPMAVETSGFFDLDDVHAILDEIDTIHVDLKHTDDAVHRRLTGVSNRRIIDNINRLDTMGRRLTLRIPLVHGMTDDASNIDGIIRLCRRLQHLAGIELLAYHPLGAGKYAGLDLPYDSSQAAPAPEAMQRMIHRMRDHHLNASWVGDLGEGE
ncbi:pyruvate formate lyase-activating protein [Desulfosarcina ovata subsp. sediminis]|uniref:Pyruvate formate lyase-activating protein n=1 Tax=Desulfosarcina ovata subsp. sediminis TaxID=885957 RepID=A0A5K7ZXY6_9BACT|nr:glycyl-radical enzyme activating protein [Desulfosarcina ovata]BBO85098.1 pyruvate formate lyase-activating protein [Desulfosarcina ovata subsp. sediminis]